MIKRGIAHLGVFFLCLLSLLPLEVLLFFARLLYYILYYVIGYRKKTVRQNLINSFPEKSLDDILDIEKKFFKYLADLIFEIIKMNSISKQEANKRVTFSGLDHLESYFKAGSSVLACTGHYGNWELGTLALGLNISAKTMVIYKPINNKIFESWFDQLRTKYGNIFISMRQTLRGIAAYKNEPTLLCFASDQAPTREETKYFLDFLHQPTAALLGVEKIAKSTNRPVFYFKVTVPKRGYYHVEVIPMCLSPAHTVDHEITKLHFQFLEDIIKEQPQYWLWSHKRWKFKPDLYA
ncbi:lysophospholipid acyltransferase family protein [Pedobacter sandarakinus]|uniref:lysophospholipid acyltransferase family protein n=1 Tax=Pedobacter sandarakinus TaxID=353156 RepID=UPI002245AA6A|nr:lysophospholipid acyltransferase family protein [Pedobacter sandarakinus]MCX2574334.1 lysophospholipid acyltransferase family protein [Pedobacter sandarakinus]